MAKKSFINIPVQGLITDLDKSKVPQNRVTVSENVRFHDSNKGDFVAKPAVGNKEEFQLSDGFEFHGSIKHDNIEFVFSKNAEGLFEAGSFPSPKQIIGFDSNGVAVLNTALSGFEDVYKPLCTIKGKKRLRTELFEFGERFVQGVAKVIYDSTYNIYYTDRANPLRLINAGFDDAGNIVNDHDISDAYFDSSINLIQGTSRKDYGLIGEIINNGELEYATYYFYLRYATKTLNVSDVFLEIGPVMINKGTDNDLNTFAGGNTYLSEEKSNKAFKFELSGIDGSYEYIEVMFTRFTSDVNGELFFESKLIDKQYPAGPSMNITISGTEGLITVIPEEIINEYPVEDRANFIHDHNNMLLGCDWVVQHKHSSVVKKFAGKIIPQFVTQIKDDFNQYSSNNETEFGYFPEEIYPIAVKAVMLNGTITSPYPVTGIDFYNYDATNPDYNENGLVRFPSIEDVTSVTEIGSHRMLGLKLPFDAALNRMTDDEVTWLNKNVKGFIIVHGERIKNRISEGIGSKVIGSKVHKVASGDNDDYVTNNVSIPILTGNYSLNPSGNAVEDIPRVLSEKKIGTDGNVIDISTKFNTIECEQTDHEKSIVAVYTAEMMLSKTNEKTIVGFCKRRNVNPYTPEGVASDNVFGELCSPDMIMRKFKFIDHTWESITVEDEEYVGDTIYNTPLTPSAKMNLINQSFDYFTEPNNTDNYATKYLSMFYRITDTENEAGHKTFIRNSNRNVVTPKYTAIKITEAKEGYYILYRKDPSNIVVADAAISSSISYYEKSGVIEMSSSIGEQVIYKGDAFFGEVNFKQMSWDASSVLIWDDTVEGHRAVGVDVALRAAYNVQGYGNIYGHGLMIKYNCVSEVNIGYRGYDDSKTFFPLCQDNFGSLINEWYFGPRSSFYTFRRNRRLNSTLESFLYNKGYHKLNSIRGIYGFNNILDYDERDVRAKARIRFSIESVAGELTDSWRIFMANSYRDFDRRNGIMIGLATVYGKLLSLQENTLNQHFVNEKQVQIPSTAGELIVGKGDVLSDRFNVIADYGIQSDLSFTNIYEKLVGYDKIRNIAWIIGVNREQYQSRLSGHDITNEGMVKSLFLNNVQGGSSDIIVSANKKSKNILFSSVSEQKSIVYDYSRNIISTVRTNAFNASISILEEFYTSFDGNVWFKENMADRLLNYYGIDHDFKLGVVVNGLSESENTSNLDKIFESVMIEATEMEFTKIEFITRNQNSILVPFMSAVEFWRNPKYELSKWIIPVPLQKSNNALVQQGSEMLGTWMELVITKESAQDFYVKTIETIFNLEL